MCSTSVSIHCPIPLPTFSYISMSGTPLITPTATIEIVLYPLHILRDIFLCSRLIFGPLWSTKLTIYSTLDALRYFWFSFFLTKCIVHIPDTALNEPYILINKYIFCVVNSLPFFQSCYPVID